MIFRVKWLDSAWRWLPLRESKRQSLAPTPTPTQDWVLLRTTLTIWTINFHKHIKLIESIILYDSIIIDNSNEKKLTYFFSWRCRHRNLILSIIMLFIRDIAGKGINWSWFLERSKIFGISILLSVQIEGICRMLIGLHYAIAILHDQRLQTLPNILHYIYMAYLKPQNNNKT